MMSETETTLESLRAHLVACFESGVRIVGNTTAGEIVAAIDAATADCDDWRNHAETQLENKLALMDEREALQREVERWRHGITIEGDYICPSDLRRDQLHSALSAALRLTYTPECSRDERWYEERERLNQVLGGESK